jgi:hypothetical protein
LTKVDENLGAQIEGDLIAILDEWHSLPETWDNELDAQIHRWYADALTRKPTFPKRPYFSPSASNSCPRELYMKQLRAKRDEQRKQPHMGRWVRIGTSIGDLIQRDLLFIEKHFEAKTGNKPRFTVERNENGEPMFEDFAKTNKRVEHGAHTFYLFGTPDGILRYTTDDGEVLRVGLEIKSKQTTSAQTSLYKMREPKEDHAKQVVAYSEMYGVDHYVILYVNASKKGWVYSDEDYEKTPDIRAFHREVTDADRAQLFDFFTGVLDAVNAKQAPKLDLWRWNFNNFKTTCALDLSDEEMSDIKAQVRQMRKSNLPEWKKRGHMEAWEFITDVREGEAE